MENILLVGCGFVGKVTADLFVSDNLRNGSCVWNVSTLSRRGTDEQSSIRHFSGDVTRIAETESVLSEKKLLPDFVVFAASTRGGDTAAYRNLYLGGLRNLRRALPDTPILFTSSTSVYGQSAGEVVTEDSPTNPESEKGKILLEAESLALASGGWVLRPGGIYGPGRSAHLKNFMAGKSLTEREGSRWVNQIHRDDAAGSIFFILKKRVPAGIYNAVDDTPCQLQKIYAQLAQAIRPAPDSTKFTQNASRKRPWTNKRVSNTKLRKLAWTLQYPSYESAIPGLIKP